MKARHRVRARKPGLAPTTARVILLDAVNSNGEPRAALVVPGRLPIPFVSLPAASAALRGLGVRA